MFKKIALIFIILCLTMLVSTVSAEEINGTVEIESVSVEFSQSLKSDEGNFTTLADDINNGGDSVELTKDYTRNDGESSIKISKSNIVIDGKGHTINANGGSLFTISGNNVVLKNMTLINGYVKEVKNTGVIISWTGSSGLLDNVVIKNSTFDSVSNAGSYQWWNSGIIYWKGSNGYINNTQLLSSTVVSSRGFVIWEGANGIINNSYFYDCTNAYNNKVGKSQATSFFIYWNAVSGKFLNSRVEDLKLGVRSVDRPYYISFTKAGYVCNVSFINCQHSNRGQTVYDLNMPFNPVEDYVKDFNGTVVRKTPTITLNGAVFTVTPVKSGIISYSVDGSELKTTTVDENGHFSLDFNHQMNHMIKVIYNENLFYNSVIKYFDYNVNAISEAYGSFTDLNNLISSSSSNVINLTKNYIYNPDTDSAFSGGIVISKSITVNGNNHYIDADFNPVRIFTTNAAVVLNNIVFKNSRLNSAGNALLAKSSVDINNCTFDNNWASGCYGAALNLAGGNSNVRYSTFTNNRALTGPAIVVNSNNNYIQYSYFKDNSKGYGGSMNYGNAISVTGSYTSYVNYNIFLDDRPLRQISADYCRNNWYGSNSLPNSQSPGAPEIENYLKASLDYTLTGNVLKVGIVFSESDTGNAVNVPWSRTVPYTVTSSTIISDNLKGASFSGMSSMFTLNAVIDNQRLTVTNGNSWYVKSTGSDLYSGTESSPFKTLSKALNNAKDGDTIYVAPGTYTGTSNVKLTISKSVSIERWGDSGDVIFDGQSSRYIFILNSNVVLSSLIFKNAKNSNGGALIIKSDSIIIDCSFENNRATGWGGAIDMNPGSATIVNSKFINNYAPLGGGAISKAAVNLNVINSVFTANHGGRGGAINSGNTGASLYVVGSTFSDNWAKSYGGALVFDGTGNITDSVFINNSAGLGGGAVYMWDYNHIIKNSRFINNSAADGGAIIFVLSDIALQYDYFENNTASQFGGAIYSFGNLAVKEGYFTKNHAYYDGGAIYLYKGFNAIYETLFKTNIAGYGGGAIHSLAADMFCVRLNMTGNISADLNGYISTTYLNSFIDFGNYTLVIADTSNYDGTLPSRFSLVENGWDTSVKNQGSLGICWDYAVIASVETALKKATGLEFDLSENNLKNLISRYSIYGNGREANVGGNLWDASSYMANSLGPVLEVNDPIGRLEFSPLLTNAFHVSNIAYATRNRNSPLANDEVKEAVIKYGGVRASINMGTPKNGYNYYENSTTGTNHAILIVGWDDNYAASNFPGDCPGDGAWIVKNSWGPNSGKNGYIYVSYYDTSFAWSTLTYIIFNDTVRYSRVYQYDYSNYAMRSSGGTESWYKNTYTSVKNEALTAFSTYFNTKTDWEVSVYVGDELKHTQSGNSISQGYFTFNFDKVIPVAKGEEFTIVVKVNNNNFPYVSKTLNTLPCGAGVSYYSKDGVTWTDLNRDNQVASLKVFTQNLPGSLVTINPIVNVTYDGDVVVEFGVENRTTVTCIVKTDRDKMVMSLDNVKGNTIKLSGLAGGDYTVTIINSNSEEYIGDIKSSNFTVFKASSLVNIHPIKSITYPNTAEIACSIVNTTTVTYIVKTKNGDVVVSNTTLTSHDKITLPLLDAGEYIITIANAENENYTGSMASLSFTVFKKTPVVNVETVNVTYPGNVVVSISSDVAGTYTVKVGNKSQNLILKADEVKNVNFDDLDADTYNVTLTYAETVNYNNVSKKTTVKVLKASSRVTINTINDAIYSRNLNVAFTVTNKTSLLIRITDKNSGKSFIIPDANITDNNVVISGLNAGNYSISINNTGDKNYNSSYCAKDFKVNKYTPKISVHTSDIIYSDALIIKIISDVSGVYTVKVGNLTQKTDIVSDTANNISFKGLNAGEYNVSVSYNESMNYNRVSKDNISVKVIKASSSVNITNASNGVYKTKTPTVTVKFENKTLVNYKITKNNLIIKQGDYNNLTSALENLNVGKYTLTITNNGDENHNQSSDFAIFEVLKANSKIIIPNIGSVVYNTVQNISFEVYNRTSVTYIIRNNISKVVVQNTTLTDNTISLRGLSCGQYTLEIANSENENYTADVKSLHFTINKAINDIEIIIPNKILPGNVTITIKANVDGLYAVNIGKYSVNVKVQSGEGTAAIAIPSGFNYTATASFEDNENYTLKVKKAIFNVTKGINNVKIEVKDTNYPDNATIELSAEIKGIYSININGTVINITINENNETATGTVHLTPNSYHADIINYYSEDYEAKTISSNFKVNNGFNTVKLYAKDIKYNESTEIYLTASVRGNYTVNINGTEIIIEVPENGATAIKTTHKFTKVGKYYVNVTSKLPYYTESITNATFNVLKAVNNIKVEVMNVTYPDNVSVCVFADVDGDYNVLLSNGDKLVVNVVDGCGSNSIKLNAGNYSAGVIYSDVNYDGNVTNASFNVLKGVNQVIVSVSDVKYGEYALINVSADVDDVYTIKINGSEVKVNVINGFGSNKTDILTTLGKYSAQVIFNDDNYNTISKNTTFNVLKAANNINIEVNSTVYPNNVKIILTADVDGIYTLKLNDNPYYVQIINKTGILNVNLAAGNYRAFVEMSHSVNYNASVAYCEFKVAKNDDYRYVTTPDSVIIHTQSIVLYASLNNDATGNVTFTDVCTGEIIGTCGINGQFTANFHAGIYLINASYEGDDNYESRWNVINLTVIKVSDDNGLNITCNNPIYGENIIVRADAGKYDDAEGTVFYYIGDKCIGNSSLKAEGIIVNDFDAGRYNITAIYHSEDYDFTSVFELVVRPAFSSINSADAVVNYDNQPFTLKVTSQNATNISYSIYDKDKKLIKKSIVNASENIELPKLKVGEYYIVLSTVTDSNHMSVTEEYDIVVTNAKIQINILAQNSTYGLKPLIKINVSVPGDYNINISDVLNKTEKLVNGINILEDLELDAGDYEITVTSRIPNFDKTIVSQRFTIEKANPRLDIKASDVKYDMNISLMIVANATGIVNITFNSNEYEINLSETNTLTLPIHPIGKYYLNATFMEDKNHYQSNTVTKTLKVNSYTASDLQKEIENAIKNNKKELNLIHDYIFSINETVVINSPIRINGNNHIINANKSSSIFKINSDNVTLTEMTLTNSNGSAILVIRDNFKTSNLSFINNSANDGGAIQIKANNALIQDCQFIKNTAKKGGAILIRDYNAVIINSTFINNTAKTGAAIYIENSSMDISKSHFKNNQFERGIGAVSTEDNVKINVDENTRLNSDALFDLKNPYMILDSVNVNESDVEIKINISVDEGNVSVIIDNEKFSSKIENKQAVIKISNLKNGKYSDIPVIYNGSDYYKASKIAVNFTVQPVQSQISLKFINNKNIKLHYHENAMFSIDVIDEVGKPVSGVNVSFNINGQIFNTKTDGNGIASFKISLKPGTYTVKISAGNHEVSNKIIIKHIISAKKTTKVKKSAKKTIIKITLKGHNVNQTSKVKFKYLGKNKVKVKFGKNMKKQKVTVKFKGKTYNVKVNKKGVGKLKLTKKVTKKLKKGKKYNVKVTYNEPKLYKKVKLVVKFKSKKYKIKTNSKGIAKFKITKKMVKKLKKGKKVKYTITYKKDTVKRFIKIR